MTRPLLLREELTQPNAHGPFRMRDHDPVVLFFAFLSFAFLSFTLLSFPFLVISRLLTGMRPLFEGTSGHVGFVRGRGCYRNACYNEEGSDPENLGNDIINFIVSHTAQELEDFKIMVDKASPFSQTPTHS
jgi:hypothetical protein